MKTERGDCLSIIFQILPIQLIMVWSTSPNPFVLNFRLILRYTRTKFYNCNNCWQTGYFVHLHSDGYYHFTILSLTDLNKPTILGTFATYATKIYGQPTMFTLDFSSKSAFFVFTVKIYIYIERFNFLGWSLLFVTVCKFFFHFSLSFFTRNSPLTQIYCQ